MQTLYQAGDAAFYANVGSLVEPLTVEDWRKRSNGSFFRGTGEGLRFLRTGLAP